MSRLCHLPVILSVLLSITGCGSIVGRTPLANADSAYYPGVKVDGQVVTEFVHTPLIIFVPFAFVDLPISFVVDTVLLPVDAVRDYLDWY